MLSMYHTPAEIGRDIESERASNRDLAKCIRGLRSVPLFVMAVLLH